MKTIEDRAEQYATDAYCAQHDHEIAEDAYIAGAEDQREIDIDKACEWLRLHYREYAEIDNGFLLFDAKLTDDFRKAMEEE